MRYATFLSSKNILMKGGTDAYPLVKTINSFYRNIRSKGRELTTESTGAERGEKRNPRKKTPGDLL